MAKYTVFQIGSQREVKIGSVEASNIEEAQELAYNEFGDADDKDRSFSSFRVEAVSAELINEIRVGFCGAYKSSLRERAERGENILTTTVSTVAR